MGVQWAIAPSSCRLQMKADQLVQYTGQSMKARNMIQSKNFQSKMGRDDHKMNLEDWK